jgi:Tfp pilus assembly protein PilN
MEMKKQDMNLLLTYKAELQRKANKISPIKMYVVIIISAALIVGAFAAKLVLDNMSLQDEIKSVEAYINSPSVVEKMSELSKINENIQLLDEIETEALTLKDVIDYKPHFDSKILDVIYYERPSTIKFTDIDYKANEVSLEYTAKNVSDVSNYVLKLQRTYSFEDVSYNGYVYDDELKLYTGTIVCLLKGGN